MIRYDKVVTKIPSNVFISYSTDAKPWAEKLSAFLEDKGVSTWSDFKSIKPGQRWLVEIQRALDSANYFLIVVGPKNQVGEWQDREWQGALQRIWSEPNKRIIPILIDKAMPPSFLRDWVAVRIQPGQSESVWLNRIYDTVGGSSISKGQKTLATKQSGKQNKALRDRLDELEGAAKHLKSLQEA